MSEGDEWTSIKVKKEVRDKLRENAQAMGVGVGKAVEILVEARQEAISQKIENIEEIGNEIADILLSSGLLDIKFRGAGVEDINIDDKCIYIHGFIKIEIPDEKARLEIYRVIKDGMEGKA